MVPIAVAVAAACIVLGAGPALADQVRQSEWWLSALHITSAQQVSKGSGVTVAVLSSGVDAAAPDLTGSVRSGPDYTHSGRTAGGPFWGISGTEIASLIAGHGHGTGDSAGVIGVAPAATILSVRVALDSGDPLLTDPAVADGLPDAIARGIKYAATHGASVIDLPLDPGAASATGTAGAPGLEYGSTAEKSAVAYALRKGIVLVAPAGDDGAGTGIVNYPAAYHGVISVGAFNHEFIKAPFSSHESYVTLTAAGEGVTAATPTGYATMNSTSAASAVVAGLAALIKSKFPALTPRQVTRALTSSTRFRRPGGRLIGSGFGTADAAAALKAAAAMAALGKGTGHTATASPRPVTRRATPAARSPWHRLRPYLRRYGVKALAGLLALLLLITAFILVRRRRRRTSPEYDTLDTIHPIQPETAPQAAIRADGRDRAAFLPSPSADAGDRWARDTVLGPRRPRDPRDPNYPRDPRDPTYRRDPNDRRDPNYPRDPRDPNYPRDPRDPNYPKYPNGSGDAGSLAGASAGGAAFAAAVYATGSRTFSGSSAGGMADAAAFEDDDGFAVPTRPPAAGGRHAAGPADRPALAPLPASRRARVSGNPPWEPAAKPDSELPWTAVPAPPSATSGGTGERHVQLGGSVWETAATGGRGGAPIPAGAALPEEPGRHGDPWATANAAPDPASEPIYVWNPAEPPGGFPAEPASGFPGGGFPAEPASGFPGGGFPAEPASAFPPGGFPAEPASAFPPGGFPEAFPSAPASSGTAAPAEPAAAELFPADTTETFPAIRRDDES
jgi:hypothetical protein